MFHCDDLMPRLDRSNISIVLSRQASIVRIFLFSRDRDQAYRKSSNKINRNVVWQVQRTSADSAQFIRFLFLVLVAVVVTGAEIGRCLARQGRKVGGYIQAEHENYPEIRAREPVREMLSKLKGSRGLGREWESSSREMAHPEPARALCIFSTVFEKFGASWNSSRICHGSFLADLKKSAFRAPEEPASKNFFFFCNSAMTSQQRFFQYHRNEVSFIYL